MTAHITYCRNCSAACGIEVTTEGDRISNIRGVKEHPVSQGYFCIKGMATRDFHNGDDRLAASLRRTEDGSFQPVEAETAMDDIYERLSRIIAEHGPESVALYYGTGANSNVLSSAAAKAWMHMIGSPFIFSSMTVDQSAKFITAGRMGSFLPGKHRLDSADLIMIVGSNPAASHGTYGLPSPNPIKHVRSARAKGTKFIVVDPRATELARSADLHVPVRPGEDPALFAGLIRIVIEEELYDKTFCERFTTSFGRLRDAVHSFTPDYVAQRTGVDVATLYEAARMFATANKKSAMSGTGPNMARDSNLAEHLIEAFNAICGGYRSAGDIVHNMGYFGGATLASSGGGDIREAVAPPSRSWESGPRMRTVDIGQIGGEFPTSRLPLEIQGNEKGKIRALIQVGGNVLKALPEPQKTIPILQGLDLLVTLDLRQTVTGRIADYQIATANHYERHDFNVVFEYMFPGTFAQVAEPFMQPPPGVIEDWQFFRGLAGRMGKTLMLRKPIFAVAYRDIGGPELAITDEMTSADVVGWVASVGRSDFDTLKSNPHGIYFDDTVGVVQPAGEDDGARLDLCPPDVEAHIRVVRATEDDVAGYPFRLVPRRLVEVLNSAFTEATQTRRRYGTNPIYMNPDDMAQLGVPDGGMIKLTSRTGGVVIGKARKDNGLRAGVISMCHAWGNPEVSGEEDEDSFSGRLVALDMDLETINFMPRQSSVPVQAQLFEPEVQALAG
ncbi:molybdopterin-dependent oxidoreductase [Sphingobium sp. AN558]|uniref:molybdopterin-containing oxidoreductase family protein n=1 Tax=Sphingobium sp. AN558 TaxID=3133442 RepID=UPI0030C5ED6C